MSSTELSIHESRRGSNKLSAGGSPAVLWFTELNGLAAVSDESSLRDVILFLSPVA